MKRSNYIPTFKKSCKRLQTRTLNNDTILIATFSHWQLGKLHSLRKRVSE